jgi:flagellar biogenesis protein FliO
MENLIIIVTVPILILIVYLIFINQKLLKKVVTYKRDDEKLKINDERYFELNNKIQLIVVVSSIIVIIGGFIGYNTISAIKKGINKEIGHYQEKISNYESIIKKYNKLIAGLDSERQNITKDLKKSIEETNKLHAELTQLQSDYTFNVRTFMVSNIKIQKRKIAGTEDFEIVRVYFRDLITTKGEKLPKFKKTPYISIQNFGYALSLMIKKVNTEFFEYEYSDLNLLDEKTGKEEPAFQLSEFDLLITVNK